MTRSVWLFAWMTCGLLTEGACVRDAPVKRYLPPPPRPPLRLPSGCSNDQSGFYVHQDDGSFRYRATDDGGTLVLTLERVAEDAGAVDRIDRSGPVISLERTAHGFVGDARSRAFTTSGKDCEIAFPTEVLGCLDGGLLLQSAASVAFDESCARAPSRSSPMFQHWLLRDRTPKPDGGRSASDP